MTTLTKLHGTNTNDVINILDGFHDPFLSYEVHGLQGNDLIIGGFGDDSLYGDQGNDTLIGLFGSNILDGGSGDDLLFGFLASLGTPTDPFVLPFINIGSPNILFGGDGNDILVGSIGSLTGTVVASGDYFLDSGGNLLYGGAGDDQLYGSNAFVNFVPSGVPGGNFNWINYNHSNTLDGGAGNDYLVGTTGVFNDLEVNHYGTAIDNFSGNNLYGGSGNDTLIGDYAVFIQHFTDLSGSNIHNWGNDHLDGGTGDDLLIGDIQTLSMTLTTSPTFHQEEHYGSDTLIGGQGNDILVGDVLNRIHVDSIEAFGNDTFVFAIGGKNGNDTVKDMNAGGVNDTLQFSGAGSVAAVDAASTFSNSGGHVLMSFAGGSVLFENIAYAGQHSVLDITPHVVVV
jgi:Ca2+-binding RTX toxin-like protein